MIPTPTPAHLRIVVVGRGSEHHHAVPGLGAGGPRLAAVLQQPLRLAHAPRVPHQPAQLRRALRAHRARHAVPRTRVPPVEHPARAPELRPRGRRLGLGDDPRHLRLGLGPEPAVVEAGEAAGGGGEAGGLVGGGEEGGQQPHSHDQQ